jgi:inner membrane transporter RhtA
MPQLTLTRTAEAVPPKAWFGVGAVFHYLGPAFAVLLFPAVGALGMAWLRIASSAAIYATWTRPLTTIKQADRQTRWLLVCLGACLAMMNTAFYLALDRLPMSLVAAMEFVGTISVALFGLRTRRNVAALAVTILGVVLLLDVKWLADPLGLFWAALNASMFGVYIVLVHRAAQSGASGGVRHLGAASMIAFVLILPVGLEQALNAFESWQLLLAATGVGVCSSVVPYICDQLAMSRLPRSSFVLLLALLPAGATVIAASVLAQIPTAGDVLGVLLVMCGIVIHKPPPEAQPLAVQPEDKPYRGIMR